MPTSPDTGNIFGATSNVNLTDIVNLNENLNDIPKSLYPTLGSWNIFQLYLQKNNLVRDPKFNKTQKDTDEIIKKYNSSISNPQILPINQASIIAAQTFHKITDPKVQIDGWVGSQTSQLKYPKSMLMFVRDPKTPEFFIPKNLKGFLPIIWGNKRFVVNAEVQAKYGKQGLYTPQDLWVPYDENIHADLQTEFLQNNWYTLNQSTEISKNATQIELQRKLDEKKAMASKTITDIKLKINTAKSAITTKL